jgi:hypothetical protein
MKKVVVIAVMVLFAFMLVNAGAYKLPVFKKSAVERHCSGFTVIEAGKGINCKGDTVRLRRSNGFYIVESN